MNESKQSAEQAARRTAAAATLGDFRAACASAPLTSPPPWTAWAYRLASTLGTLLDDGDGVGWVDELDDVEPYCTACREWAGLFIGIDGWRHFKGDWAPGGQRTLFEADHEPVIGWVAPPGRPLSPAGLDVLGQALGDAVAYREPGPFCMDCEACGDGLCPDHAADLDRCGAYLVLASVLGIEVER